MQNNIPSSCLLPRTSLRIPYAAFLDAVRDRLIDKVSQQQPVKSRKDGEASIKKLLDGFVLGLQECESHWSNGWSPETRSEASKLVHCYLHISLLPTRLLVQPLFRKVPLTTLGPDVAPGSPIVMLPYGTPAYYIGPYVGSAREQERTFRDSLNGLGCRNWAADGFVVCWMTVRNTSTQQSGVSTSPPLEERGLLAIWPRALCLSSTSPSRQPLASIPAIPSSVCPPVSPPRPTPASNPQKEAPIQGPALVVPSVPSPALPSPPSPQVRPSHTPSSSLGALKSLTIDASAVKYGAGMESVASEITSYVDWIVKEREREKERLAKEKERARRDERPSHAAAAGPGGRGMTTRSGGVHPLGSAAGASASRNAMPPGAASHHRPQGSATNPQGYYPSPPEVNSPATNFPDQTRLAVELSPQIAVESLQPQSNDQHLPNLREADPAAPSNEPAAQPTPDTNDALGQGPSSDAILNSSFEMDVVMGMEDVTEDDFNFFDVAKDFQMASFEPPETSHAALGTEDMPPAENTSDDLGHDLLHPDLLATTSNAPDVNITAPNAPFTNVLIGSSQSHAIMHPNSTLPLSPAQTPSSSPSVESPASPSAPSIIETAPPSEEPSIPPEFAHRVKELIPKQFEPLPVPASSVITDRKYNQLGAKYNIPPSSVSSPALLPQKDLPPAEDELQLLSNEFVQTTVPSALPGPPSLPLPLQRIASRLLEYRYPHDADEAEQQRMKKRIEQRTLRERPIRHGNFEVWHSRKFIDKFATGMNPRVNHVKRLRGQKRNLEWSPYPYFRYEGDGDSRSTWNGWAEFSEVVPAEAAAVLNQEETDDETDSPSGFVTEDETVIANEPETAEETPEGTSDARSNTGDREKSAAASSGHAFRTPPPVTAPPTPLGASLLQTLFHPHHIFPLASAQTPPITTAPSAAPPQAPMSVPTPVSPAAHFVQAGEGAAMLEGAADVLTREVVENSIWADAARAAYGWTTSDSVSASEVDLVASTFKSIDSLEAKTTLQSLTKVVGEYPHFVHRGAVNPNFKIVLAAPTYAAEMKSLIPVSKPPMVVVGQSKEVVQLSAPSLRFWEKLGLMPLNGVKDVVAFALYEEDTTPKDLIEVLSGWLVKVSKIYKVSKVPRGLQYTSC